MKTKPFSQVLALLIVSPDKLTLFLPVCCEPPNSFSLLFMFSAWKVSSSTNKPYLFLYSWSIP